MTSIMRVIALVQVVTLVLSVALLFPERKAVVFYPDDDDESCKFACDILQSTACILIPRSWQYELPLYMLKEKQLQLLGQELASF